MWSYKLRLERCVVFFAESFAFHFVDPNRICALNGTNPYRIYQIIAMDFRLENDHGDRSFPGSAIALDRKVEDREDDHDLRTIPSLPQVKSAYPPFQQVQSAGIPPVPEAEFKPTTRLYLAFGTLAVITLMVALDGTSLSVALPVGSWPIHPSYLG